MHHLKLAMDMIRCLTLAKELRSQGHYCKFICRNHKGNLIEKIERAI